MMRMMIECLIDWWLQCAAMQCLFVSNLSLISRLFHCFSFFASVFQLGFQIGSSNGRFLVVGIQSLAYQKCFSFFYRVLNFCLFVLQFVWWWKSRMSKTYINCVVRPKSTHFSHFNFILFGSILFRISCNFLFVRRTDQFSM